MVSEKSHIVMISKYMRHDHLAGASVSISMHGVRRWKYTDTVVSEKELNGNYMDIVSSRRDGKCIYMFSPRIDG